MLIELFPRQQPPYTFIIHLYLKIEPEVQEVKLTNIE